MSNILILGSGTQGFAIIESLYKAGHRLIFIVHSSGNYADDSKYVDKKIIEDHKVNSDDFFLTIKRIIQENDIETIIPMGDQDADFLSLHKNELKTIVHYKIPDHDDFLKGYDKNQLMTLCQQKGYPHPLTIDLSKVDFMDNVPFNTFPYPGLLKPNCTSGGRGMVLINNHDDLIKIYPQIRAEYGECHFQQFIREGGRQVKIQLYLNEYGELLNYSVMEKVRWFPVKGGSSCCSVSTTNPKMVEICYKILKDINWIGFADFDLIENPDTKELLVMEINPRLPACIGAAIYAGIDWGQIIVDDYLGKPQKQYSYKEGVTLRHLGFDVLWFIKSPNRFKTKPNWFNFFGNNVYYQDFHFWDQKPFWIGTYHNIKKLLNPSFRKSKSGTSSI